MELCVKGEVFGMVAQNRGRDDPHQCIKIIMCDDDNWTKTSAQASSYWLDELIDVATKMRELLNTNCIKEEYGWKIK